MKMKFPVPVTSKSGMALGALSIIVLGLCVVGCFAVVGLIFMWTWNNLFVLFGLPVFSFFNGIALAFWIVCLSALVFALKETK